MMTGRHGEVSSFVVVLVVVLVSSTSAGPMTGEKASTSSTSSSSSSSIISPLRRLALRVVLESRRDDEPELVLMLSRGPLGGRRFRLLDGKPGLGSPKRAVSLYWLGGALTNRMLDGNVSAVGVAGNTLIDVRGERAVVVVVVVMDGVREFNDADDAFECECECRCRMDRTDDTDDDVDFRPRSPAEGRRNDGWGVWGAGESELRRRELVDGRSTGSVDGLVTACTASLMVDCGSPSAT